MHHYCFGLKSLLPNQTHARPHTGLRTRQQLAQAMEIPLSCLPGMADLPQPSTRCKHSTRTQWGWMPDPSQRQNPLPGRVRRTNHFSARIPQLFLAWCPTCCPDRERPRHKMCDQTVRDVYEATLVNTKSWRLKGCIVVETSQCEWERHKEDDEALHTMVESFDIVSRLKSRDAFFGERTNAVKLHHHVKDDEELHYYDFTSLYP